MEIVLKDGSKMEFDGPATVAEIAQAISPGLARVAVGALVDGETRGLNAPVTGGQVQILRFEDGEGKKIFWHTASHILAHAVKRLYPQAKLAIGPAIDAGFYYDFDIEPAFTQEDLTKIEEEMKKIVKEGLPLERYTLPKDEALKEMAEEPYKVELIKDLPEGETISFYRQGDFADLCAGPHLDNVKGVKAFKLINLAGAYWRGDEKNKMLTRIYGVAFPKKSMLEAHLKELEEAKERDHNRLGRELGLFTTVDVIGQGLPLLTPKGAKIIQVMQRFVEDTEEEWGYQLTKTPVMAKSDLYKISGHWDHYRDGMFIMGKEGQDEEVMALRPMTCPFQFMIYKSEQHSYRDLPVRYSETSPLFRNEASGEMHGLIRVRQFTLADGHIICTPEQLEKEFTDTLHLLQFMMRSLGIEEDIWYRFSKWDPNDTEKYIDNPPAWESSQKIMKGILDKIGLEYIEADGEAAFYGPKLDVQFKNVHGKEDTIITLQVDFALAERFDLYYVDQNDEKQRPYIIHRSSIGCYERTLAMLIEKYAGAFPVWLAPEQVRILSITNRSDGYIRDAVKKMRRLGIRAACDLRNEKIGYKIREARMERIPYVLIVGDKEVEDGTVAVRRREEGDVGAMDLDAFLDMLQTEIEEKT